MKSLGIDRNVTSAVVAALACLLVLSPIRAQDTANIDAESQSWDVFVKSAGDQSGSAEIIFFNLLTGEATTINSKGERFTLVDEGVIYFDRAENQVKFAAPEGRASDHSFMVLPADALRIDWVVSEDRQRIAWTIAHRNQENLLLTRTMIADTSGSDVREVLIDGPWLDSRVLPVAFNAENDELYMDAHADSISEFKPFSIYVNLFALDLSDRALRLLPNESDCFCSAAIRNDLLLRLIPTPEFDGVQVKLDHIINGAAGFIPAIRHDEFSRAGDLLQSPDGTLAIYALSQERSLARPDDNPQSVFVLADLQAMEQSIVGEPVDGLVFPYGWSEGNAAVLFTDDLQNHTWKLELSTGTISEVAEGRYLGRLERR